MQRSRKALLQKRRALEEKNVINGGKTKRLYYKVSLSLFVVMWWLFFPILIGHGDTDGDGSGIPFGESTWHETKQVVYEGSDSESTYELVSNDSKDSDLNAFNTSSKTKSNSTESPTSKENENDLLVKEGDKVGISDLAAKAEKDNVKTDRLSRAAPVGLDEFKSKAITPKEKPVNGQSSGVTHRVEADGAEYNYASSSKGAKVLAFNKEAKGASNILGKDKDKYLRNPCSAESKFVVIELSEETLVDTIEIANFEHYSSNLKEFELLGSLVYPTDKWVNLGSITAENVKHVQKFTLEEPKWVRYIKLNLLNHYGSEFYCTLSSVGVYGVDAVERMVQDLISVHDNQVGPEELIPEQLLVASQPDQPFESVDERNFGLEVDFESGPENQNVKREVLKTNGRNPVPKTSVQPQQAGRMPGDTALKILLQKVRSMDLSLSVLERYLDELNSRYGNIFKELDDEMAAKDELLEKYRIEIKNLADSKEVMAKDVYDLIGWKSLVSLQMDKLQKDNSVLRSEVERVLKNQIYMENKGIAILLVSLTFGCMAILKLLIDLINSILRLQKSGKYYWMSSSWLIVLLSSSVVIIVLL